MKATIILFLLLISISSSAQKADTIHWRQGYNLQWEDFQGIPDTNTQWAAVTSCSIEYTYTLSDTGVSIKVFSVFYKKKSWAIRHIVNLNSLKHERIHFDINELFARKFLLEAQKTYFNKNAIGEEIKKMHHQYFFEAKQMNNEYDLDTDYGLNEIKQHDWSEKVKKLLSETRTVN